VSAMEDLQQQKINEAAHQFVEALTDSYGANIDFVAAQKTNAELTRRFFETVINDLRERASPRWGMPREELVSHQERQVEAARAFSQESARTYTDFLDSLFFYWRITR
jgi:hypothetical protein